MGTELPHGEDNLICYGFFSKRFSENGILSQVMPSAYGTCCFVPRPVKGGMGEQQGLQLWFFIWHVVTVLQLLLRQSEGCGGNGPSSGLTLSLSYELV